MKNRKNIDDRLAVVAQLEANWRQLDRDYREAFRAQGCAADERARVDAMGYQARAAFDRWAKAAERVYR